jgi:hypothetical protein
MVPPASRDTLPPDPSDDAKAARRSTLPPFASDERVTKLEDQHAEVMATLGEIRGMVAKLTDRVTEFHENIRRNSLRITRLAARVALLDDEEEGELNGNATNGS